MSTLKAIMPSIQLLNDKVCRLLLERYNPDPPFEEALVQAGWDQIHDYAKTPKPPGTCHDPSHSPAGLTTVPKNTRMTPYGPMSFQFEKLAYFKNKRCIYARSAGAP